jgi:nicotinate dehydrogenase subunit A
MTPIRVRINGQPHDLRSLPSARLLDVLRDELGLKGAKFGCGQGDCGACQVLLDGRPMAACDTAAWAVQGRSVTTVEGVDARLRQAFIDEQAAQCGYCSAGMLVAASALLAAQPQPSDAQVRAALDGQLCRCGAHNRIVRAVLRAAGAPA